MSVMVLSLYGHVTGLNVLPRTSAEYPDGRVGICFLLILLMNDKKSNTKIMTAPMRPYSLSLFAQRIHRA